MGLCPRGSLPSPRTSFSLVLAEPRCVCATGGAAVTRHAVGLRGAGLLLAQLQRGPCPVPAQGPHACSWPRPLHRAAIPGEGSAPDPLPWHAPACLLYLARMMPGPGPAVPAVRAARPPGEVISGRAGQPGLPAWGAAGVWGYQRRLSVLSLFPHTAEGVGGVLHGCRGSGTGAVGLQWIVWGQPPTPGSPETPAAAVGAGSRLPEQHGALCLCLSPPSVGPSGGGVPGCGAL